MIISADFGLRIGWVEGFPAVDVFSASGMLKMLENVFGVEHNDTI